MLKRKLLKRFSNSELVAEVASSLQMLQNHQPKKKRAIASDGSGKIKSELPAVVSEDVENVNNGLAGNAKKKSKTKAKEESNENLVSPRWRSWPHEEEVFLIGAVMERFFTRGSLSSSKREEGEHCWTSIKHIYDHAWQEHVKTVGSVGNVPSTNFMFRSANALARHYKVMKERIMHNKNSSLDFRQYYKEWETKYNKDSRLLKGCKDVVTFVPPSETTSRGADPVELPKSRWSYEEEVFLVAAVLERFFQRGSLASTRLDTGKNECWASIKQTYDTIRDTYNEEQGSTDDTKVKRSARALTRHFKVMKVRFTESSGKDNLKRYFVDWKHKYNSVGASSIGSNAPPPPLVEQARVAPMAEVRAKPTQTQTMAPVLYSMLPTPNGFVPFQTMGMPQPFILNQSGGMPFLKMQTNASNGQVKFITYAPNELNQNAMLNLNNLISYATAPNASTSSQIVTQI